RRQEIRTLFCRAGDDAGNSVAEQQPVILNPLQSGSSANNGSGRCLRLVEIHHSGNNTRLIASIEVLSMELSVHDESETPHGLVCTEVWGGNRKVSRTIELPSLRAWVASHPINDEEGGGDLHYMSVCDYDLISRVALADVSGHGQDVSAVTQTLRQLMHENINV